MPRRSPIASQARGVAPLVDARPGPSVTSRQALTEFVRRAVDTIYHPAGTCRMGTDNTAVVDARLRLRPGDRAAGEAELAEIVRWRRENQPGGQNAGSVFVNPVPGAVAAGELVDQLGLRGLRVGSAEVSSKHANFIQADEGGSADDVYALMRIVRERVREATGVLLRSEIRLVGFDEAMTAATTASR